MRRCLFLLGVLLLCAPITSHAFSFSTAIGYAGASHFDDMPMEWFGASDGINAGFTASDFIVGQMVTISFDITLNNSAAPGANEYFSIWADFDQNQVFDDYELIYSLEDYWFENRTTTVTHTFMMPEYALTGDTWLRARLTFDGPLAARGTSPARLRTIRFMSVRATWRWCPSGGQGCFLS